MKKKGIATLVLAGALAATMMPAFAATKDTTVGYVADGNVSTNGKVMVTVPKNVTFTKKGEEISGFNVEAKVWSADTKTWVAPTAGGISMGDPVSVTVNSANDYGFKKNGTTGETSGKYEYKVNNKVLSNDTQQDKNKVGDLQDGAATLAGTVTLKELPETSQSEGNVEYKDTLTFTFTGGAFQGQGT